MKSNPFIVLQVPDGFTHPVVLEARAISQVSHTIRADATLQRGEVESCGPLCYHNEYVVGAK